MENAMVGSCSTICSHVGLTSTFLIRLRIDILRGLTFASLIVHVLLNKAYHRGARRERASPNVRPRRNEGREDQGSRIENRIITRKAILDPRSSILDPRSSSLEAPAFAVFALQILIGVGDVRDLALFAVVVDALALTGLHSHDAEEHRFGQAAGILEGAGGLLLALNGVDPVHPVLRLRVRAVVVLLDADVGLRNF